MGVTAAVAAVVGTSYAVYSGEQAKGAQKKMAEEVKQNAKAQAIQADQANNKMNAKKPDQSGFLAANQAAAAGGIGGTMLTGPQGVSPNALQLGKNTLLGS